MRRMIGAAALLLTTAVIGAVAGTEPADASPSFGPLTAPGCATAHPGAMHCLARYRTTDGVPSGLSPTDIADAYHLDGAPAPATVVAIVDAYDDPNAEADLAVYRQTYGLPPCTTANGCFAKVNQQGATTPLPDPDPGWATEISLDVDAVSAACPSCHILLVEADTADTGSLGASVDTAVRLGAAVVSNSYGTGEYPQMDADQAHWQHPGTSIVASSGDDGFTTASFPAVLVVHDRRRRHHPDEGAADRTWLDGGGLGRRRQRVLGLHRQAVLAARQALPEAHGCRRVGGRRSRNRAGGV